MGVLSISNQGNGAPALHFASRLTGRIEMTRGPTIEGGRLRDVSSAPSLLASADGGSTMLVFGGLYSISFRGPPSSDAPCKLDDVITPFD